MLQHWKEKKFTKLIDYHFYLMSSSSFVEKVPFILVCKKTIIGIIEESKLIFLMFVYLEVFSSAFQVVWWKYVLHPQQNNFVS